MPVSANSTYSRIDLKKYAVIPVWYGCNSACTICMLSSVKGKLATVDFETFSSLVTSLVNEGIRDNLILSGAEITTFDRLEHYVRFAASFGWFRKIQIQTNGRKLADGEYVNKLVSAGVNEFFISIHGLEESHDAITRIPGSYAATMSALDNLEKQPVNIISNTVLTCTNIGNVVALFRQLCDSPVSEMHLWNFFPMDASDDRDLVVSLPELLVLLPEIMSVIAPSGKQLVLKGFPECISPGAPCSVDSDFPLNLIQDDFWFEFSKNGFGTCVYRDNCAAAQCWGLSSAYREKYGDERQLLTPLAANVVTGTGMETDVPKIELSSDSDRFFNYCLWEYPPVSPPAGKFKAATLLYHSFVVGQAHANALRIVDLIREAFGEGSTVWGVKLIDGSLKWEFYFYDYRRRDRERSIARLVKAISPVAACSVPVNDNPHYFMFSVDIDNRLLCGAGALDEIHMYVGNVGSNVSSGISYSCTAGGNKLENLYYFFDANAHQDEIRGKICCSGFVDVPMIALNSILWPELAQCSTICLANKQHNDCIYFSGITVDQLLFAMTRLNYPPEIVTFISNNKAKLDHLRYDFGIDYTLVNGEMNVVKSGYYGTF